MTKYPAILFGAVLLSVLFVCFRGRRGFRRAFKLLCLALVLLIILGYIFLHDLGKRYLPPRRDRQPSLPYGLSLVDSPKASGPIIVDVVFVHGLGSFADSTWRRQDMDDLEMEERANALDTVWIRDLLPEDLPSARLLFFNYDSTAYNDAPRVKLKDLAMELQTAFHNSDKRTLPEERKRPIIFLCHSYGGLLVKQAIVKAVLEPEKNEDLLQNIYGAVFLGTPHKGSRHASWGVTGARLLNSIGSNPDIYLEVEVNSTAVVELHDSFMTTFSDLPMTNFYENRETQMWKRPSVRGMIVEPFSATFEAPNTKNYMMNTDHSGLNKFNSRSDEGYKKVLQTLRLMIGALQRRQRSDLRTTKLSSPGSDAAEAIDEQVLVSVDMRITQYFTERIGLSRLITEYMDSPSINEYRPRSLALWGLGGSGKSQLALRYLETHKDKYNPVMWIDARTPESARAAFWAVFLKLGLPWPAQEMDQLRKGPKAPVNPVDIREDSFVNAVLDWLESGHDLHKQWLLVLDNADDLSWVKRLIPQNKQGSVIVTSRDGDVHNLVNHHIEVLKMSEEESQELLFKAAGITRPNSDFSTVGSGLEDTRGQDALDIVNYLENLALAVDLAGAYIRQRASYQEDFSLYLNDLKRNSVGVLARPPTVKNDDYSNSIITVWETSFEAVNNTNPRSAQLLKLFAFFDRANLDDRLFPAASWGSYLHQTKSPRLSILQVIWVLVWALFWLYCLPLATIVVLTLLTIWGRAPHLRSRHTQKLKGKGVYFLLIGLLLGIFGLFFGVAQIEKTSARSERLNPDKLSIHSSSDSIQIFLLAGVLISIYVLTTWLLYQNPEILGSSALQPTGNAACHGQRVTLLNNRISSVFGTHLGSFPTAFSKLRWSTLRDAAILRLDVTLSWLDKISLRTASLSLLVALLFFVFGCALVFSFIMSPMYLVDWMFDSNVAETISKEAFENTGKLLERLMFSREDLTKFDDIEKRFLQISSAEYLSLPKLILRMLGAEVALISPILTIFIALLLMRNLYNFAKHNHKTAISGRRGLSLLFIGTVFAYMSYRAGFWIFGAQPGDETYLRIQHLSDSNSLVKLLISTNDDNTWNPQPYSEAYSVLSRFGFLQRTKSKGFSMHSLVQGWARHRMDAEEQEVWIREGTKLFKALLHNEEVWLDSVFQSRQAQHLLELVTAHLQNRFYSGRVAEDLISLLNASLRRVELGQKRSDPS